MLLNSAELTQTIEALKVTVKAMIDGELMKIREQRRQARHAAQKEGAAKRMKQRHAKARAERQAERLQDLNSRTENLSREVDRLERSSEARQYSRRAAIVQREMAKDETPGYRRIGFSERYSRLAGVERELANALTREAKASIIARDRCEQLQAQGTKPNFAFEYERALRQV